MKALRCRGQLHSKSFGQFFTNPRVGLLSTELDRTLCSFPGIGTRSMVFQCFPSGHNFWKKAFLGKTNMFHHIISFDDQRSGWNDDSALQRILTAHLNNGAAPLGSSLEKKEVHFIVAVFWWLCVGSTSGFSERRNIKFGAAPTVTVRTSIRSKNNKKKTKGMLQARVYKDEGMQTSSQSS